MSAHPLLTHLPNASKIVYGCMGIGGGWNNNPVSQADITQTHQIIDSALDSNINVFDHADIYTFSKAEMAFGKVLAERPSLRESIYLQSKCGIRFDDAHAPKRYDLSAKWITQSVDGILSRLNTEYLDVLMLHRPDPLTDIHEVAQCINGLIASGKINHLGVSNMHQHQIAHLQSVLAKPIVCNQIELSLQKLDWLEEGIFAGNRAGNHINFTAGTLEHCQQKNIQIQSWGSLCQGVFSLSDNTSSQHRPTAELVNRLASEYGVTSEAILLAWIMRHPSNIQPVIGTTNPDRINACKDATQVSLSREHWYALYVSARGEELP